MQNLSWFSYLTPVVILNSCQESVIAENRLSVLEEEEELERISGKSVVAEEGDQGFPLEELILDDLDF